MSAKIPAIGSIKTFEDAKAALDRIRSWFISGGATGTFKSADGKTVTVENGRITSIK